MKLDLLISLADATLRQFSYCILRSAKQGSQFQGKTSMNIQACTLLALVMLVAGIVPALGQSAGAFGGPASPAELFVPQLLSKETLPQQPPHDRARDAVATGLAKAKVYKFVPVDYPGAEYSIVQDKNATTMVGTTSYSQTSAFRGFTLIGGNFREFFLPNSSGSFPFAINTAGKIVGFFRGSDGYDHGFLDVGGVISNVEGLPYDINDEGEIVGSDGGGEGFSTPDGVTYTQIIFPNANSTGATGVNTAGEIVGYWEDGQDQFHGFLLIGGQFTTFDFPLATSTYPQGVNDSGEIAGYFTDASSVSHGFVLSGNTWAQVDVPGAQATALTRIKNNGNITGYYVDQAGENHGMTGH